MGFFNRNNRNASSVNANKENTVQNLYNAPVKYSYADRQATMSVADNKALELPEGILNVCDDFMLGPDGKKHMVLYNTELKALMGPAKVVFSSFADAYDRKFNEGLNVRFERNVNFFNMKNIGRAMRLLEHYDIARADESFRQEFARQLDGATDVIVFMAKDDPLVVRAVRFDGLDATVYAMEINRNRDINAQQRIEGFYLRQHRSSASVREEVAKWNEKALAEHIPALVDANTVLSKFTYAAFMAEGFKLVIPVLGSRVKDIDAQGEIVERWLTDQEHRERILNGSTLNGKTIKGKAQHILDGYRRQAAQDAGLTWEDFVSEA